MPNARETAVEVLMRCERGGYSNLVLMNILSENGLDARDRAFCTALVYGTLSRKITIDAILSRFVSRDISRLDMEVRQILRTGVYQIFWMDSVPLRAAINESVELCRRFRKSSASGFVNAVLRKVSSENISSAWSDIDDETERMSVKYSMCQGLVELLAEQYGDEAESVMSAMFRREDTYLRVNSLKCGDERAAEKLRSEGIEVDETEIPHCLRVLSGNPVGTTAAGTGLVRIQSFPAQYAAYAASAVAGNRVLDMCAAPGGKTVCMAQDMKDQGDIISLDINAKRLKLIDRLVQEQNISIVKTCKGDASEYDDPESYDIVLCDVPCSGYGEIHSKPELRYKDPSISEDLPDLQYRILCNGARLTRQGGRVIYSTCTILDRENIGIIRRFLKEHDGYSLRKPDIVPEGALIIDDAISFTPGRHGSEGFFVAMLIKM